MSLGLCGRAAVTVLVGEVFSLEGVEGEISQTQRCCVRSLLCTILKNAKRIEREWNCSCQRLRN